MTRSRRAAECVLLILLVLAFLAWQAWLDGEPAPTGSVSFDCNTDEATAGARPGPLLTSARPACDRSRPGLTA
jgi:hypothetical protein